MATPVNLIGGYYKDDALPWSAQDTVNWAPVVAEAEGTRSVSKLATLPGLKPWLQVGSGPIRGMHDMEGGRFVVSGGTLTRINPNNTVTPIGTIPGIGRVSMTHNQFETGFQLLVENGQGGGGYVFTSSDGTFQKITDEGYPGSISTDYLDSFLLGVEPLGRFWFHSDLANALSYNTLDRYEAEGAPDRIVGLKVRGSEVVVFGQRTTEFFFNAGTATGTFQNRRQTINRGCASRHTIARLVDTLFWLGDDGIVYMLEGYSARPISTGPMAKAFAGKNWSEAFAEVWEDRGHKVYYLTFTDGETFGYDVVSGFWHRRESYGLTRWRLSHIQKWGSKWYGGDFQNGNLWEIDWDYILEGDAPLVRRRVSPVAANNQSAVLNSGAELVFDVGRGPPTEPIPFPSPSPSPTITGTPTEAIKGIPYSFAFTVSGGTPPNTVELIGGSLPLGLVVSPSGVVSGTPVEPGVFGFYLRVTDSKGMWSEISSHIDVQASVMALATTLYLFTGSPNSLQESTPTGIASTVARSLSVSPNTLYMAAGNVSSGFLYLRKKKADSTGYDALPLPATPPTTLVNATAFSRDGKYFALLQGGSTPRVMVYEIVGDVFTFRSQANMPSGGFALAWNESSSKLVAAKEHSSSTGNVAIFDVVAGVLGTPRFGQASTNGTTPISLMWKGNNIVAGSSNQLLVMRDTGTVAATVAINPDGLQLVNAGAVWSAGGDYIYALSALGQLRSFAFSGSSISPGVLAPAQPIGGGVAITINSTGEYLAVGASGSPNSAVQIYRASGGALARLSSQPATTESAVSSVRWTEAEG